MKLLERGHTDLVVNRIEGNGGVEITRGRRAGGKGHALFYMDYALRCVHEGELYLRYRGQEWRLPAGSVQLACPGEVSVIVDRPSGVTEETHVFVSPDAMSRLLEASGHGPGPLPSLVDGRLTGAERLDAIVGALVQAAERRATHEAEEELIRLAAALVTSPPAVLHRKVGVEPRAVRAMRDLLVAGYARNITLDELAREAGMSKYYSAHLFKSYVGVSPHRFVTGVRVAHARELLRRGVACGKVAECCGFSDQSHMTRHFTRLHEISPSRYARGNAPPRPRRPKRTRSGVVPVGSAVPAALDEIKRDVG